MESMGRTAYLPTFMVDFYGFHVGNGDRWLSKSLELQLSSFYSLHMGCDPTPRKWQSKDLGN